MKKQYACLGCGFIHSTEPVRERLDQPYVCMKMMGNIKEWHGFIWYRICPECKHKKQIRREPDL